MLGADDLLDMASSLRGLDRVGFMASRGSGRASGNGLPGRGVLIHRPSERFLPPTTPETDHRHHPAKSDPSHLRRPQHSLGTVVNSQPFIDAAQVAPDGARGHAELQPDLVVDLALSQDSEDRGLTP